MLLNTTHGDSVIPTTSRRRSERSNRVTIEIALLLSIISVGFGVFSAVSSKTRNDRKDTEQQTEDKAATHTMLITKLENISDDLKEIKRDYRDTRLEVQSLRERVVAVESSLKSYHKRLDGEKKTDQ